MPPADDACTAVSPALLTARLGRVGFVARELLDEVPTVLRPLRP